MSCQITDARRNSRTGYDSTYLAGGSRFKGSQDVIHQHWQVTATQFRCCTDHTNGNHRAAAIEAVIVRPTHALCHKSYRNEEEK